MGVNRVVNLSNAEKRLIAQDVNIKNGVVLALVGIQRAITVGANKLMLRMIFHSHRCE